MECGIDELKSIIRSNFREIEGTREVIKSLKRRGYKLGLLSVHGKEWIEYCESSFHYHCLFDAFSYSYENGIGKPDEMAYLNLLNRLGSIPEESLFIDDSQRNIEAALNLGIQTILFIDSAHLRASLKEIGILID